jgi:RNA polymerase sigma factor (sigma-70 family)
LSVSAARRPMSDAKPTPSAESLLPVRPSNKEEQLSIVERERIDRIRTHVTHIWNTHRDYLRALGLRWLRGNVAEAEDAVADVVYKASVSLAHTKLDLINERAWLTRILHNRCMDIHRNGSRQRPLETTAEHEPGSGDALGPTVPSGEDLLLNAELGQVIERALAALPPALRHPAVMRLRNDESYARIAQSLQISQANARKRIQLARQLLQQQLRVYLHGRSPRP